MNKHKTFKKIRAGYSGFTLIELLVVISIIGFLVVAAVVSFNIVRMSSRDAQRLANVSTITKALAMYLNDVRIYPLSGGECLTDASGAGAELKSKNDIIKAPLDPSWPSTPPTNFNGGATKDYAISPASNFCYYYYSEDGSSYSLSFYLESNSKSGSKGIHVASPAKNQ